MRIVVIGAGAAGLVAAAEAANRGARVSLLEKNNKTGVKILMSGGTRCNVTHHTDALGITKVFGPARRFLQASVGAFPPDAVVQMLHSAGVATKTESTGKIFPQSDRALDVRDALQRMAVEAGVDIHNATTVTGILPSLSGWIVQTAEQAIRADRVIVTSGGKSYPGCGTTGDAYDWLRGLGHTIVPPRPALVPLVGGRPWTHALSGLTVEDCRASIVTVTARKKTLDSRRGSWLFTHFGFSGPAAMDISGALTAAGNFGEHQLLIDLLPGLPEPAIRAALSDRSFDGGRQRISATVRQWLPNRLATALIEQVGEDHSLAELPRAAMGKLVNQIKRLSLPVTGTRGFAKAEVTAGGVDLREVDPRTMASRVAPGLFIAGEVLDIDGPIGGYNFQAAFSTGRAAGIAASG